MLTLIVQTSSGALHGDDRLGQDIHVGPGAAAHVTTQGAQPVYRANEGLEAVERVRLVVEAGGFLEYLPEPKILFPGSALLQTIALTCDAHGSAVISDAFLTHDPEGRNRGFRHLTAETTVCRPDGEPLLTDRVDIQSGLPPQLDRLAFRAFGTLFAVLPGDEETCDRLRIEMTFATMNAPGLYAAASSLPYGIGVGLRLAADGGSTLREGLAAGWRAARHVITGQFPTSRRKS